MQQVRTLRLVLNSFLAFALERKVWDSPEATVGSSVGLLSIVVSQVSGGPRRKTRFGAQPVGRSVEHTHLPVSMALEWRGLRHPRTIGDSAIRDVHNRGIMQKFEILGELPNGTWRLTVNTCY